MAIWRYCPRCGWVGETTARRCADCTKLISASSSATTRRSRWNGGTPMRHVGALEAPQLQVLPIPIAALKAAHATGGGDAVLAMLAEVFNLTPETLRALVDNVEFPHYNIFAGLTLKL